MRKRSKPKGVSNRLFYGAVGFSVIALLALGALMYGLRAQRRAPETPVATAPKGFDVSIKIPPSKTPAGEDDGPVIRAVERKSDAVPAQPGAVQPPLQSELQSVPIVAPKPRIDVAAAVEIAQPAAALKNDDSNELIGEIKGQSYTAKKAQSNSFNPANPGNKPEPKKIVPPKPPAIPPPPPGTIPPKPPAVPKTEPGKIDVSKLPVFVLKDGRRIRALAVRDNGAELTVKNEAGKDITFKKTELKEILKG